MQSESSRLSVNQKEGDFLPLEFEMFHQRPIMKQLQMLATILALANFKAQQLAGGQASNVAEWIPNEDSWNYWWSYSGISGPSYWGLLNLDWHMCDKGRRQSPINIETKRLVYDPHLSPLQLDNNLISGILHNDGHAIVFNASARKPNQQKSQHPDTDGSTQIRDQEMIPIKMVSANRNRRHLGYDNNSADDSASIIELAEKHNASQSTDMRELSQKLDLSIAQSEVLDARESNFNQVSSTQSDLGGYEDDGSSATHNKVQIAGAGLSYGYHFEAIYFRFGLDNKQAGSEHLINSKWHSAELQILAYNSILYKNFHEASNKPHGLLAISILVDLFEQEKGGEKKQAVNGELDKLLAQLTDIKYRNQMVEVRDFNLSALLPETRQFISYEGSLNVPGCHESVDWLLLNKPLYITQSSLDLLRSISADEQKPDSASGTLIAGNLRPTQALNNRPIRTNIKPPSKLNPEPAACQRLWTRYDYRLAGSG